MKNLFVILGAAATILLSFFAGGLYADRQRVKTLGYDCVLHVGLTPDTELGMWVKDRVQNGKCATVLVVK